jgi:hypothetical protein
MTDSIDISVVADAISRINNAWLVGRPNDLTALFHPDMVMALPEFTGHIVGAPACIAGYVDFCNQAAVETYRESDLTIHGAGGAAVVSYL